METPAPHLRAEVAQARREAVWVDGMSDDLVERLRKMSSSLDILECEDVLQAADRIEELEGAVDWQRGRAEAAEAKLANAVDIDLIEQAMLDVLEEGGTVRSAAKYTACTILAELEDIDTCASVHD